MDSIPLGAGYYELETVRVPPGMKAVMMLKAAGYDGPVVIELKVSRILREVLVAGEKMCQP